MWAVLILNGNKDEIFFVQVFDYGKLYMNLDYYLFHNSSFYNNLFFPFQTLRNHIIASEASSTLCIIIFIMASSSNKDWDADFCCDLAELMVSSEEEEVVSAGVPTELRVSLDYFS